MITSKRGYYATDLLSYTVVDRYNKKIGKISDLLVSKKNFKIAYIVIGKKKQDQFVIPSSLITSEEENKTLRANHMKERLVTYGNTEFRDHVYFTDLKNFQAYDIKGEKMGTVANLTFHPGLKINILVGKFMDSLMPMKLDFEIIPNDQVLFVSKDNEKSGKIIVNTEKICLDEVNISSFEDLFISDRLKTDKKRYIILECNAGEITNHLAQINTKILETEKFSNIKIEVFNSDDPHKVTEFVEIFNFILLNSPDTYVPITNDIAIKYFTNLTFVAYQYNKAIGYTTLTIQNENNKKIGVVSGIGIHPNHRGKKLSLILFKKGIDFLQSKGCETIQADIFVDNIPSLNLFSSFGFQEVGEIFLD